MRSGMIPLYPYQIAWLEDLSELKGGIWCRSSGKTFVESLEIVIDCERAETKKTKEPWFTLTQAESQTRELIQYATIHCKAFDLAFEDWEEEVIIDKKSYTQLNVEFEHGSRIVGLPTNKNSVRGKHGSLYWDEPAATPDADEIWGSAAPIAGREGRRIRMTGTGGVKKGPFYEAITGKLPGWSIHRIDLHRAIADGAPLDLEKIKRISRGQRFRCEYLCEFEDDGTRLIAVELIWACEDDQVLLVPLLRVEAERKDQWAPFLDRQLAEPKPSDGFDDPRAWARLFAPLKGRNVYLGFDVARRGHLSVLWITEPDGVLRNTRAVIAFAGRRFTEQKAAVWAAMEHCHRGCIDATGMGMQLAEEAVEKFGNRVEAINFSGTAVKDDLASRMLRAYEDRTPRIPVSVPIRDSIHSVYKITTAAGNPRYDAEATDDAGHADYFWAQALSLLAAGDGVGIVPTVYSEGERTWANARSGGLA
jgi:phage FluMu gp28-like protein